MLCLGKKKTKRFYFGKGLFTYLPDATLRDPVEDGPTGKSGLPTHLYMYTFGLR